VQRWDRKKDGLILRGHVNQGCITPCTMDCH
jgi:hypothetical protein